MRIHSRRHRACVLAVAVAAVVPLTVASPAAHASSPDEEFADLLAREVTGENVYKHLQAF